MKRNFKKILSLSLAIVMLLSLAGCGANSVPQSSSSTPVATVAPQPSATPVAPVTIKMFASTNNQEIPNDIQTQAVVKALQEKTNVILDIEFFDNGTYRDLVNMKFAAGEYPDVYQAWNIAGETPYENGLLADLSELVDKYGPNLKKNIAPAAFNAMTVKGKLWAIPTAPGFNLPSGSVIYVRKDWYDQAGIKELPKTSDDLLNMWRAFRDADFNGNGVKDEIPFSSREKFTWNSNLFGMWGIGEKQNYVLEDGNLMYCFASKNFVKAIEFMATAYQEGLIDSEILTNTMAIWTDKIVQNRVGSWNHVVNLASDWQQKLTDANPGKDVTVMAIPTPKGTGYTGPIGAMESPMGICHMIFNSASEEVKIAAVKMFDYLATEEGNILSAYGIEGDTLIKDAAGNFTFDAEKQKQNQTAWFKLVLGKVEIESVRLMIKSTNPKLDEVREQAISIGMKEGIPNYIIPMPAPKALVDNPDLAFSGAIIQECLAQIILGQKPIDYYYECLAKWKAAGGDKLIKEVQDWYTANLK